LPTTVQLGNKGGLITLLNRKGLKVDGVSYTAEELEVGIGLGAVRFRNL
jgi:hypothetical protein